MGRELKGYVVFDTETTTTTYMKRKASPFTADNWVVAAAYKVQGGSVEGSYYGNDKIGFKGWLAQVLEAHWPRFLVGFNEKFDILWAIHNDPVSYAVYQDWIVSGGQLWDVQLAEYLLEGQTQESQMMSLNEVAPRYGGSLKIDEVKAMWEQGINTPDIPRQLLMDYLVGRDRPDGSGRDMGDIDNTELAFLGQLKASKKAGNLKSIQLNNGALVASIEMELNGLYVNQALAEEQRAKLQAESETLTRSLNKYLPSELPFEFNWGSPRQRSALIFGGTVGYEARQPVLDEKGQQAYSQMKATAWVTPDGPMVSDEPPANVLRYSGGQSKGLPKTKQIDVNDPSKPKSRLEKLQHFFEGFTKPRPEWANDSGYSTKAEVIEELGDRGIPFLEDFAKLISLEKDLGTYYVKREYSEDGELKKETGMLILVGPDSIIHHKVNHTSTVTGRLSHSDPNAGNLPKHSTSEVKMMFESRFKLTQVASTVGGVIISSDFKTLEVYCQANLSHDKQLVQDLRSGIDVHSARLSTVEGLPYEEVLLLTKGNKARGIKPVEAWENKRTDIKVFSFQRAYGAGPEKISRFVKKPKATVQEWIDADEKRYPGITKFNAKVESVVKSNRVPTARYVRHPVVKVQLQLGRGWMRTFDGKKYVFSENASPDFMVKHGVLQSFTPTELKNYPVQGLGGEWMKAAMWLAVRLFYKYKNFGGLALLINTVHDALYVDAHESVRLKAGIATHASMLAASDLIEWLFGYTIDVPVPSETSHGPSMYTQGLFDEPSFDETADKMRAWLRKSFMDGNVPSYLRK